MEEEVVKRLEIRRTQERVERDGDIVYNPVGGSRICSEVQEAESEKGGGGTYDSTTV